MTPVRGHCATCSSLDPRQRLRQQTAMPWESRSENFHLGNLGLPMSAHISVALASQKGRGLPLGLPLQEGGQCPALAGGNRIHMVFACCTGVHMANPLVQKQDAGHSLGLLRQPCIGSCPKAATPPHTQTSRQRLTSE